MVFILQLTFVTWQVLYLWAFPNGAKLTLYGTLARKGGAGITWSVDLVAFVAPVEL